MTVLLGYMTDSINVTKQFSTEDDYHALIKNKARIHTDDNHAGIEQSARIKTDTYEITVSRFRPRRSLGRTSESLRTFVNVPSTARFLGEPDNLRTCSANSLKDFANKLEETVCEILPDFRFETAQLTRLDLTVTLPVPHPYYAYTRILQRLNLGMPWATEHKHENLVFRHIWSHFIQVYDKRVKLLYNQDDMRILSQELGKQVEGIIRIEERLTGSRQIQKALALRTGEELLKRAHSIGHRFQSKISSALSNVSVPPLNASFSERVTRMVTEAQPWGHSARNDLLVNIFAEFDSFFPGHLDSLVRPLHGAQRLNAQRFLRQIRNHAEARPRVLDEADLQLQNELIDGVSRTLEI